MTSRPLQTAGGLTAGPSPRASGGPMASRPPRPAGGLLTSPLLRAALAGRPLAVG